MSDFMERLDLLSQTVGHGRLRGSVEVNQIYAHYQHEHPEFHHPDGGEAFYLLTPLLGKGTSDYMERLAVRALAHDGSHVQDAMVENMEDLSNEVYLRAPWEFGDLRASGHPVVEVSGSVVYDRRPHVERLGTADLKIKSELRYLFDPHRYREGR